MTFAYYTLKAGAWVYEHSHPNDEVWNVIDGQLEISVAGKTEVAGPGCVAIVPPDTVRALTDARAIVVDYTQRHYRAGIDLQLMDGRRLTGTPLVFSVTFPEDTRMITGAHFFLYSKDADADIISQDWYEC